jgi:hypothetical protein
MRDIYPPKIRFYKPNRVRKESISFLTVILTDRGKGVKDSSIDIRLNGNRIYDEFDPDRSRVRIKTLKFLKKGKNIITISLSDYAGNKTEKKFKFYLY